MKCGVKINSSCFKYKCTGFIVYKSSKKTNIHLQKQNIHTTLNTPIPIMMWRGSKIIQADIIYSNVLLGEKIICIPM